MIRIPFLGKPKKYLGIDIGTFSIKIVELSYSKKGDVVLENYGEKVNQVDRENFYKDPRKKTFSLPHQKIADNLKNILSQAKIGKREAIFSIPDFMTFFTVFRIPPLPKEEIASAVEFEARQHIPLPLKEVSLDWSIVGKAEKEKKKGPKILLVAVPNKVISEYQKIAEQAGIKLLSIEAEVFSLARASVFGEPPGKAIQIVDIGVQSTTISVVREGTVELTYSINLSENEITKALVSEMDISYNEAERIKYEVGFDENCEEGAILCSQLNILADEIKQVSDNFFRTEKKEIRKIALAGGIASSPGIIDYLEKKTHKEVRAINPFLNLSYPPILKETIEEIGPRYAIAAGIALRDKK